jgi:hypothetical protein
MPKNGVGHCICVANCVSGSVLGVVFLPLGLGFGMWLLLPVVEFPTLLVCRADQCMGPGRSFGILPSLPGTVAPRALMHILDTYLYSLQIVLYIINQEYIF